MTVQKKEFAVSALNTTEKTMSCRLVIFQQKEKKRTIEALSILLKILKIEKIKRVFCNPLELNYFFHNRSLNEKPLLSLASSLWSSSPNAHFPLFAVPLESESL